MGWKKLKPEKLDEEKFPGSKGHRSRTGNLGESGGRKTNGDIADYVDETRLGRGGVLSLPSLKSTTNRHLRDRRGPAVRSAIRKRKKRIRLTSSDGRKLVKLKPQVRRKRGRPR